MSRFKTQIQLNKPDSFVNYIMQDFFNKELFTFTQDGGEGVWQHGQGLLTGRQFIKCSYQNGTLTIEAWLKFALLPGVYLGELGLDGAIGAIPKSALKSKVNNLIRLLTQPLPSDMQQTNILAANQNPNISNQPNPTNGQPIPVYTHDTSSKATLSLILGIASFCGIISPLIGVILGSLGIVNSRKAARSKSNVLGTIGMILSILGIIISVLVWIFNIIYGVSRF